MKDLLVAEQQAILGAAPKACKTLFGLDIGMALATGTPALGFFEVPEAVPVVIMTGESGLVVIRRNLECQAAYRGLRLRDVADYLHITSDMPRIGEPRHLRGVARLIQQTEAKLLIVDPIGRALGREADPANMFKQYDLLGGISDVCAEQGCTLLLLHHVNRQRRGSSEEFSRPPSIQDLSFAGFDAWCRQWVMIGRQRPYEHDGIHKLWVDVGGSYGHGGEYGVTIDEGIWPDRHWQVEVEPARDIRQHKAERRDDAKSQKKAAETRARIDGHKLKIITELSQPDRRDGASPSAIRKAASINNEQFDAPLLELVRSGEVIKCKVTTGNHKTAIDGYRLRRADDPEPEAEQPDVIAVDAEARGKSWAPVEQE